MAEESYNLDRVIILLPFENFMCGMFVIILNEYYLILVIRGKRRFKFAEENFTTDDQQESFGASLGEDLFDPLEPCVPAPDSAVPKILCSSPCFSGLSGLFTLHFFVLECAYSCLSVKLLLVFQAQGLLLCELLAQHLLQT